jgi:uncharacterized repeat protein (TIGR01451 family)
MRALAAQFACILALFAGVGAADAAILVNKAFTPTSVALGGTSTVTITLQNTSTLTAANVTAFSDDIATMAGGATIASPSGLATTCAGGNPSITGTVVSMSAGVIPIAPSTTVSGTCTITFNVVGAIVGNGVNTIAQGALVTDQGSNGTSASQTLQVTGSAPTVTPSGTTTVTTASTATNTFTIANPNGAALTNVTIPITATANSAFTITGVTISGTGCSGSETFPTGAVTSATTSITIPSFPANASCVVTFTTTTVSQAAANTVTYTSASTSITDDQGVTNSGAKTSAAAFITGRPTITKSFTSNVVSDSDTTTLTIKIPNIETQALTTVGLTDTLPNYLTVDAAPNFTTTNCGAMTNTSVSGSGTVSVAGGTVAAATTLGTATAASTCTITILLDVSPTAPSVIETNTIPSANLTDDQNLPGSNNATANITITATGLSDTKAFAAATVSRLTDDRLTLTFTNASGTALTFGSFIDYLPQTSTTATSLPMTVDTTTSPTLTFTGCGATPSGTYANGNTVVSGNNLQIAAHSTCTVSFNIVLNGASGTDTNTLLASNAAFFSGASQVNAGQNVSANVTAQSAFTAVNYVAAAGGLENQPLTVQASITDRAATGVTDTNVVATFVLNANATPHSVALAPSPNFTFGAGCPTGTTATPTNANGLFYEGFTVNAPTLSSTCTITYNVINEQTGAAGKGTFAPGSSTYTSTENVVTTTTGATNNVTFYNTSINVNKTFSPIAIVAGSTSTASITLSVKPVSGLATTLATGVGFVDSLPANLVFATTPNVTFSAGCQQTGQPTPSGVISGTQITVTNVSLIAVGTTATNCVVGFDTTSTALGNVTNTLPVGAITSPSVLLASASNTQAASASLSVTAGVSLLKTFVNPTLQIGATDTLRFLITNSASSSTLASGTLTDNMPATLALASTTVPANQAGDPPACGGTIVGTVGASTFHITGMTVLGTSGGAASQCVQYVLITTSTTAAPGTVMNTIPAGALTIGGYSNTTGTTGSTNTTPPPGPTITKAFATPSIVANGTSVLTITIANTAVGAAPLTAMALTDTLPTNVVIAATPNASTTCPSGSVTAVASSGNVALSGGTLAAGATCTIVVTVTSATPGNYTNTIPASALTTTQGATNATAATATLAVTAPPVVVTKAFAPASIISGGTSTLTVTIANTNASAVALTGLALTDTLPTGVTVAATPAAATTCPSGTAAATAGGATLALTGGTLAAGASCTMSVSVTSSVPNAYVNTIPIGAVTSTQGASNTAAATATLTVTASNVTLSKSFLPATINPGGTSVLTLTIANTATGAGALTGLALTDTLPAGVTIAATPATSTTCGAGTVAATAGGTSVALSAGTLGAGATCTVSVSVTGTLPGGYVNTIPIGALTSTQGASNAAPASATLTIADAPPVVLTKAFAPASIISGGASTLTVTIANTNANAVALTALAVTDTLPSGVTIAATPAAATTCPAGTAAATAGGTTLTLIGGTLAAGASCTMSVSVTATIPGGYTNTIPIGAVTSTQGASNTAAASATLTVTASSVTIAKAFAPATINPSGISVLTITVANTATGAAALTGVAVTDTLPTGVTIAATPNTATTCGAGTVTAAAGGTTVALAAGTLAAGATCTITVSVTGTLPGAYVNTIPIGGLTSTQGASNTAPATATLTIQNAPPVTITKSFTPANIPLGGVSQLTVTIANTATGAVALTNVHLQDLLPTGMTIAATPNFATTCPSGTVTQAAGPNPNVTLSGATLAAGATCTITANVTSSTVGASVNTIPASALTSTQGATNTAPASATLTVAAPSVILSKAFAPATISINGTSALTISIANTATGAVALSSLAVTDALPTGVTVAPTPNASTTCGAGTVTGAAGATSIALANGTLAAGATCTITISVTSATTGAYVNTIPVGAVTSAQGGSNAAVAQATLTVVSATLSVTKTSTPANSSVSPGQRITYTITIVNSGTGPEANATITDTLTNATLVSGSVTVNGVAAADAVVTSGAPFGTIAAGATATIVYAATVNAAATPGTSVTNSVVAGGTQPCTGPSCSASSGANLVTAPTLSLVKTINGVTSIGVVNGETVSYGLSLSNTGAVPAQNVVVTDPFPAGATPIAGSITVNGIVATNATIVGQTVTIPIGTVAVGQTIPITIGATIATTGQPVVNVANAAATGLGTSSVSNAATASVGSGQLIVSKTSDASVVQVGDRVNYTIVVRAPGGVAYGVTTIVDTLPSYEAYAPGTARINGKANEPVVHGRVLTWTVPSLTTALTITYAVAIVPGAPQNGSLTNVVDVRAVGPGGGAAGTGTASATITVIASTFGSCYPITGRVYLDTMKTGSFVDGDTGIGGVRVYLDDGESIETDPQGRYNFPCVRPGMHALRLDASTLPSGAVPYDDRRLDSERSTRRLVHRTFDTTIIEDINFAIRDTSTSP